MWTKIRAEVQIFVKGHCFDCWRDIPDYMEEDIVPSKQFHSLITLLKNSIDK